MMINDWISLILQNAFQEIHVSDLIPLDWFFVICQVPIKRF